MKFEQNIDLYKEIVRDPVQYLDSVQQSMVENDEAVDDKDESR